ncbi:hypothetical protein JOC78_000409 [Bacillus ectoiniformans]|uniref:hypothetical protein n=1 Tax=Bacillus ectoiniformans TaxID=1494429 RepID=UPI00195D586E|nr:hypothetical protein [Bacillus ectoiniformans]MBM7647488.1 hypothetical protein [Bacillus ectoiniformans]
MNKPGAASENQNEQSTISSSLRLALIAGILTTIADGIATIAALQAIDEEIISQQQDKQDQMELDAKLEKLQEQIDQLTDELLKIKSSNS